MADPISVCASVIAIAGAGIKLSTTLYTYSETAFHADKSLKDTARDVSLTSAVLGELGMLLEQDKAAKLCSTTALKTADQAVGDCREVFKEIEDELNKSLRKGKDGKVGVSKLQSLKWPFMEPRLRSLQGNLERLKTSLLLMLNVLSYARKLATDQLDEAAAKDEKQQIQKLIIKDKESRQHWHDMQRQLSGLTMVSSLDEGGGSGSAVDSKTGQLATAPAGLLPGTAFIAHSNSVGLTATDKSPDESYRDISFTQQSSSLTCLCGNGEVPSDQDLSKPYVPFHISAYHLDACISHIQKLVGQVNGAGDWLREEIKTFQRQPEEYVSPCQEVQAAYHRIFGAFERFSGSPTAIGIPAVRKLLKELTELSFEYHSVKFSMSRQAVAGNASLTVDQASRNSALADRHGKAQELESPRYSFSPQSTYAPADYSHSTREWTPEEKVPSSASELRNRAQPNHTSDHRLQDHALAAEQFRQQRDRRLAEYRAAKLRAAEEMEMYSRVKSEKEAKGRSETGKTRGSSSIRKPGVVRPPLDLGHPPKRRPSPSFVIAKSDSPAKEMRLTFLRFSRGDIIEVLESSQPASCRGQIRDHVGLFDLRLTESVFQYQCSIPHFSLVKADHNFTPRSPDELQFSKGDIMRANVVHKDNWWTAILQDSKGLIPKNYVHIVYDGQRSHSYSVPISDARSDSEPPARGEASAIAAAASASAGASVGLYNPALYSKQYSKQTEDMASPSYSATYYPTNADASKEESKDFQPMIRRPLSFEAVDEGYSTYSVADSASHTDTQYSQTESSALLFDLDACLNVEHRASKSILPRSAGDFSSAAAASVNERRNSGSRNTESDGFTVVIRETSRTRMSESRPVELAAETCAADPEKLVEALLQDMPEIGHGKEESDSDMDIGHGSKETSDSGSVHRKEQMSDSGEGEKASRPSSRAARPEQKADPVDDLMREWTTLYA